MAVKERNRFGRTAATLEREASNQKMVEQFRRDMEVWKDQAHATKVAQERAVRERNRFGKRQHTWNMRR